MMAAAVAVGELLLGQMVLIRLAALVGLGSTLPRFAASRHPRPLLLAAVAVSVIVVHLVLAGLAVAALGVILAQARLAQQIKAVAAARVAVAALVGLALPMLGSRFNYGTLRTSF